MKKGNWRLGLGMAGLLLLAGPAAASPWAEAGDNQLRGDIELLAAAGVIDGITTQWPLPWQGIVRSLQNRTLNGQPESVRAAAARVMARARAENQSGLSASLSLDGGNRTALIYGFDGMGRGQGQARFILDFNSGDTAARMALGAITGNFRGRTTKLMPDESYLAEKFGPVLLYGGWMSHWWGPGWVSALSLSNNARPMPQLGIERLETTASRWPVLRWLGPWQAEFLVGMMDGPRIQSDTFYNGLRFTFNPAPGLEIGLARTQMFCGQGHPCVPVRDYFSFGNTNTAPNNTNDQGLFDIKYSTRIGTLPVQVYAQMMNEDSSPFVHSDTSHLFGASIFLPAGVNPLRLTAEYTDSVSTVDMFSFGDEAYGVSYTNTGYPDGMRYRGRTIGFSLDNDSHLFSLQGAWSDPGGRQYQLSFHHAKVGDGHSPGANILSPVPQTINLGEAKVTIPFRGISLALAGRLQDEQLRPHRGVAASLEAALRIGL